MDLAQKRQQYTYSREICEMPLTRAPEFITNSQIDETVFITNSQIDEYCRKILTTIIKNS